MKTPKLCADPEFQPRHDAALASGLHCPECIKAQRFYVELVTEGAWFEAQAEPTSDCEPDDHYGCLQTMGSCPFCGAKAVAA